MKYVPTSYKNIFFYETKSGKRYRVRRNYFLKGVKKEASKNGFSTIASARAYLANIEKKLDDGMLTQVGSANMKVKDYWEIFSNKKISTGQWSADAERTNDSFWRCQLEPRWGNIKLKSIDRNQYEEWIADLLKKYTRTSVRSYHKLMSAVINDAIYGGIIDYNPIERVFIGKSEKDARNKKMTNKQFHEWMDTAKRVLTPYHYSFTYAAVFGFRRAEIMGFHLKDLIVQANGTFMIHVWDSRTQGKPNGKGTTKTDKERYVALDVEGTRLLQSAIEETKRIKAEHGLVMHRDDFIFVDDKDGKPVYVTKLNECFQRVNKECAFQAYPNLLRHHFATEAVNSGAPIEHVANYLGNSPDVLRSNYLHIEDEVANNVVGMFEKQVKTGTGE